ncbi:MAG: 2Fe-2S iron-sulfur cluster binding domain-containing protein [Rhodospirillales bacterium]|nr:2Fe-2S iron-sulfur cluster binding domain-containing protein [Rhodospirillales bacterium]
MQGNTGDWQTFQVVRKKHETEMIASFHLAPCDGMDVPTFRPGQFLTVRLPAGEGGVELLRTYSISSPPDERRFFRISVKREPAPAGLSVPPGRVSTHLHDHVQVGQNLTILPPRGDFVLSEPSQRSVLLLSGGVGLTPMVAMAHRLAAQGTRRTWFIHACENGRAHAFRDEVASLAARAANLRTYACYNRPDPADREAGAFDAEGLLTAEKLQSFLPIDDYECYLCGPPGFMQALYATLIGLGVCEQQIHYEFFGPASVLKSGKTSQGEANATASQAAPAVGAGAIVTFARSGFSVRWDERYNSILEFAEAHGVSPDFSCRAGVCSTCRCALRSGAVTYFEEPLAEPGAGMALICCSRPDGDVTLDL